MAVSCTIGSGNAMLGLSSERNVRAIAWIKARLGAFAGTGNVAMRRRTATFFLPPGVARQRRTARITSAAESEKSAADAQSDGGNAFCKRVLNAACSEPLQWLAVSESVSSSDSWKDSQRAMSLAQGSQSSATGFKARRLRCCIKRKSARFLVRGVIFSNTGSNNRDQNVRQSLRTQRLTKTQR